jgi:gamma-glutamylcyclotransferase (GGCT)/AIG2-like uncharacterized protein YtfP
MSKKFFVYGTLKEGGHFAKQFDGVRKSAVRATLHNMDLFNLGWFPTIKPGDGQVVGEVHEYEDDDKVLRTFDGIEGYNPERPEAGLYRRDEHEVVLENGETVKAIAYTFNGEIPAKAKKIEDGVWPI